MTIKDEINAMVEESQMIAPMIPKRTYNQLLAIGTFASVCMVYTVGHFGVKAVKLVIKMKNES